METGANGLDSFAHDTQAQVIGWYPQDVRDILYPHPLVENILRFNDYQSASLTESGAARRLTSA